MIVTIIIGMTVNPFSISQPITKQHIFTKVPVKSLIMGWFKKYYSAECRKSAQYF